MEPSEIEMLRELTLIRHAVTIVAVLLACTLIVRVLQSSLKFRDGHNIRKGESIRALAVEYFDAGQFVELVAYLKPKIRKEPNNSTALYWLARAYLELDNKAHAAVLLRKVKALEPGWDEKYIAPYIDEAETS